MIYRVRDFPRLLERDFGPGIREALMAECVADFPVREDGIDRDAREVVAVITSDKVDSVKTILGADAFMRTLSVFMAAPICLPEHQRKLKGGMAPCVGSAQAVWREADKLLARVRFADTEVGRDHWAAYRDGHMRQFSIGFLDHQWEQLEGGVDKLVSGTIRELSTVAVASNTEALVVNYVAGRLGGLASREEDEGKAKEMASAADELTGRIATLEQQLTDAQALIETLASDRADTRPRHISEQSAAMADRIDRKVNAA
jgi:hypothetical protein